jgi:hypothetical protein
MRSARILLAHLIPLAALVAACDTATRTPGDTVAAVGIAAGQSATTPAPAPPTPATKIEAFKPAAGSVVTFGYDERA